MELTVSLLVDARAMLCLAPCAFGGARVRMGLPLCLKFQRCCTGLRTDKTGRCNAPTATFLHLQNQNTVHQRIIPRISWSVNSRAFTRVRLLAYPKISTRTRQSLFRQKHNGAELTFVDR
jgi:hypothetical protein